ncbi:MAG: hypothetical protein QOE54_2246 [Streptosporangiaceae bacterium]|jgi:hypothetical protein|nr:hypothetical protein [Streptosporangiaceae bacterium]MDX6429880.1 hypothetical protein [Streptosporangiaceae bacterium]
MFAGGIALTFSSVSRVCALTSPACRYSPETGSWGALAGHR